jgi:hypothetical protein
MLDTFLAYSWSLKMKASSETLMNVYQTTQYHIPEHNVLHSNHCENLRPSTFNVQCWHYVVIYFDQGCLDDTWSIAVSFACAVVKQLLLKAGQWESNVLKSSVCDVTLHSYCYENLESNEVFVVRKTKIKTMTLWLLCLTKQELMKHSVKTVDRNVNGFSFKQV